MLWVSKRAWAELVAANSTAVDAGWAEQGVFATATGSEYRPGAPNSVLYVGKSAGPLGTLVGSGLDQSVSAMASRRWMESRRNKSAFWQFAEKFDPTRRSLAWTNVCKMDRRGGQNPPTLSEWKTVREACLAALADELAALRPRLVIFATSDYLQGDIIDLLGGIGFKFSTDLGDRWTSVYERSGTNVIMTKHPQGWATPERDSVASYARALSLWAA